MSKVELPAFHYFEVGNRYSGHIGQEKRYQLVADKDNQLMTVQIWFGPYCQEKSEVIEAKEFALDDGGYEQMIRWLENIE